MELEKAFRSWMDRHPNISDQSNLVAVSGGLDSMVMLHLCNQKKLKIEVVHINYGLRGEESDLDEQHVVKTCEFLKVPCHVFKWSNNADSGSLQMRCREFRYSKFEKLMIERTLENTLVAHHSDDSVETVLLNIFRGTGIRGLAGITENRQNILRPLLETNREEIVEYGKKHNVEFRDDRSNFESDYDRNFIRNEVLLLIRSRFENADRGIQTTARFAYEVNDFIDSQVAQVMESLATESNQGEIRINLKKLRTINEHEFIFREYLGRFNFGHTSVKDILSSDRSGANFQSSSHTATLDRGELILQPMSGTASLLSRDFNLENPPEGFAVSIMDRSPDWSPNSDSSIGEFDLIKLKSADLKLRSWQEGDRFQPLGMSGWKKLSDLFVDQKTSVPEKSRIPILTAGEEIFWVVGMRMDERFKVTDHTTSILRIEYHRSE